MKKDPLDGLSYIEKYESVSRMRKALDKKYMPLELDRDNQTCMFKGSGKEPYYTTLDSCTCPDWVIRGRDPDRACKHMYRLAHELGLCDLRQIIPNLSSKEKFLMEEAQEILSSLAKYWEFMPEEVFRNYIDKVIKNRFTV